MLKRSMPVLAAAAFLLCSALHGQMRQETMHLKLPDLEKMFLDSNFQLLAQKYNVNAQRASVIQARLWPNPNFSISHGLYSGTVKQFFPSGANDETTVGLSQLILL